MFFTSTKNLETDVSVCCHIKKSPMLSVAISEFWTQVLLA
jgi:hypothetical protein